jgi:hypothetical protein
MKCRCEGRIIKEVVVIMLHSVNREWVLPEWIMEASYLNPERNKEGSV